MSIKVCCSIHVRDMCLKWGKLFACAGPGDRAAGPMRNGYVYTEDLLLLSQKTRASVASLPSHLCGIVTPLREEEWAEALCGHPDQGFARYLLEGIRHGFRIGYDGMDPNRIRRSAKHNMQEPHGGQ